MRSIAAIRTQVHRHISPPSPHSIMRWARVSVCPQKLQRSLSERAILLRRSLVRSMSCSYIYHVDRTASGIQASCRFCHIRGQLSLGCIVTIRSGLTEDAVAAMVCITQYMRLRLSFGVIRSGRRDVPHIQGIGSYMFQSVRVGGGVWWVGNTVIQTPFVKPRRHDSTGTCALHIHCAQQKRPTLGRNV
jgi:hypothetical protein